MPKQSKIRSPRARQNGNAPENEPLGTYVCTRCGRVYHKQRSNFSASHSPLFAKNGGYLTVCVTCVDAMFNKYKEELGSEAEACKRVCMKFDIYWNDRLFATTQNSRESSTSGSLVRSYLIKTNLAKYVEKTFDDTMTEEKQAWHEGESARSLAFANDIEAMMRGEDDPMMIDPEDVEFWGEGYTFREYEMLNRKYQKWVAELPEGEELDMGRKTLYRQICALEMAINKSAAAGKPADASINQLNNLLGSVNAKPNQKAKDDAANAPFDSLPFGVGIRMCENSRPIPKPLPQFDDVDGVVRTISVWFLGHLCKMLHIKNAYCKMYEDEMAKLRIERPEFEDEDDETLFNSIFGDEDV